MTLCQGFFMLYICSKKRLALILNIETSTKNCSVSISKDGEIISLREINNGNYSHAEKLHPLIVECLQESSLKFSQIEAIAVGKGPGSYTGLRIGVSAAKGLCFSNNIPLLSINSLEILANSIHTNEGYIVPMIDARRMEVYSAIYSFQKNLERETLAEIIDSNSYSDYLDKGKVYFLGDGSEKCKDVIQHPNAVFIESKFPSANEMAKLSEVKYKKNDIEDVAYFEPFYLKDFIVTSEKKKV